MLSGGATRNVATWRVLIRGINGMTLGFPAGFSIVFWPKFKTSPLLISFTFQKAKQKKYPNDTLSVFSRDFFLLQFVVLCFWCSAIGGTFFLTGPFLIFSFFLTVV